MSFKKIMAKKAVIAGGAAIVAGLATATVCFLSKSATKKEVDEVINEENNDEKIVEVDFQEEENKETVEMEEENEEETETDEE